MSISIVNAIKNRAFVLGCRSTRNAICFKIHDKFENFYKEVATYINKNDWETLQTLPSNIPFESILLAFDDSVHWFADMEVAGDRDFSVISASFFSEPTLRFQLSSDYPFHFAFIVKNFFLYGIETPNVDGEYEAVRKSSDLQKVGSTYFCVLQRFLQLLSCKNIKQVKNGMKGVSRKAIKRGAVFEYYTLQIKNISSESEHESGKWHNRIHFVRGHMKEYTDDAPLFGRITGRFWCPSHVRGKNKDGMIVKDYEL